MATSPIQSGAALQDLTRSLLQNFDANRDGNLNVDEFSTFLSRFIGSLNPDGAGAAGRQSPLSSISSRATRAAAHAGGGFRATMEGFDAGKLANPDHRTPKYLFGRLASNYDLSGVKDKAAGEALLRQMSPELEQAGLKVLDVKGDKIKINHEGQDVWIDVIRGCNSGTCAWQWLPV